MSARAKLSLAGIGRGSEFGGSPRFARILIDANLFARDEHGLSRFRDGLEEIEVSFSHWHPSDYLQLADLATLALVVRHAAEAGRRVTIQLPGLRAQKPPAIYYVLEKIGFMDLFSGNSRREPWQKLIKIKGRQRVGKSLFTLDVDAAYVPLRWFSRADFAYNENVPMWHAMPTTGPSAMGHVRSVIVEKAVLDPALVRQASDLFFLELGWNTVLHSQRKGVSEDGVGAGLGVFCAQMSSSSAAKEENPPRLDTVDFCVADLGIGIPRSLRAQYEVEPTARQKISKQAANFGEATILVDYAGHAEVSSRPIHASILDKSRARGLAALSHSLGPADNVILRSDGGCVRLVKDQVEYRRPSDVFRDTPLPGTQASCRLVGLRRPASAPTPDPAPVRATAKKLTTTPHLVRVPFIDSFAAASNFAAAVGNLPEAAAFDLEYAGWQPKQLEYLITALSIHHPKCWPILWNVDTPWDSVRQAIAFLHSQKEPSGVTRPPLVVRGDGDAAFIGRTSGSWGGTSATHAWLEGLLAAATVEHSPPEDSLLLGCAFPNCDYLLIANHSNSGFVADGFRQALDAGEHDDRMEKLGFFAGEIHTIRGGDPVKIYYALTRAASHTSFRKRWAESAKAALQAAVDQSGLKWEDLVVIGFTVSVNEVLKEAVISLGAPCAAFVVHTFDVPTKEELKTEIDEGKKVILFTDIVTSGKLVDAVYGVIRRIEREVVAVVALVDNRPSAPRPADEREAESCQCWITTASIPEDLAQTRRAVHVDYWVDPISLVPSRTDWRPFDPLFDAKVRDSLEYLYDSNAVSCGHAVDGVRHSSVFVHVNELVARHLLPMSGQVLKVCFERMKKRRWRDFDPKLILYPSEATRIERLAEGGDRTLGTRYGTETLGPVEPAYMRPLRKRWSPEDVPSQVVRRAFDPGGTARCEMTIRDMGEPADVIIVDDGLWRGTTAAAMTDLAIGFGAKRILVIPILARTSPIELAQYESIESVSSRDGRIVKVCYCFPFVLPIPYYSPHECPYEVTIQRMKDHPSVFPKINAIQDRLARNLEGRRPAKISKKSRLYTNTWLKIRTYVELSGLGEKYVMELVEYLREIKDDESLIAILTLFVEEWRLLDRLRLRQALKPYLRGRASELSLQPEVKPQVRMAAATLLRCHFRRQFVDALPGLGSHFLEHPNELARLALQVETLDQEWRGHPKVRQFWDAVSTRGPEVLVKADSAWSFAQRLLYMDTMVACRALATAHLGLKPERPTGVQNAAGRLLELLSGPNPELHDAVKSTGILANPNSQGSQYAEFFPDMSGDWNDRYHIEIAEEVIPLVTDLANVLAICAEAAHFASEKRAPFRDGGHQLRTALAEISSGLQILSVLPSDSEARKRVLSNATFLRQAALDSNSTLIGLLDQMRKTSVTETVDAVFRIIRGPGLIANIALDAADFCGAKIRCPLLSVRRCADSISFNHLEHAFRADEERLAGSIAIKAERFQFEDRDPVLRITITNDGRPLEKGDRGEFGATALTAAKNLAEFGGCYHPPARWSGAGDWKVLNRIDVPLCPDNPPWS